MTGALRTWGAAWFSLDLRWLARMRIGLGLCAVWEFTARIPVFEFFYGGTASVILPPAAGRWSPSLLSGAHEPWLAWAVLCVGLVAALAFTAGLFTRVANLALLICLVSFQAPHFHVAFGGGGVLLRQLLLICLFLPVGAHHGLDARRRAPVATHVWSLACFALLIQLVLVYLNGALAKSGPSWTQGTAVAELLQLDCWVTPIGRGLRPYITGGLAGVATHATLVIEVLAPLLLLVPWRATLLRRPTIAVLMGFHLSIWLLVNVAHFSPVIMCALLPLLGRPASTEAAPRWQRWPIEALAGLLLWLIVSLGARANSVTGRSVRLSGLGPGPVTQGIAWALSLDQHWLMFAPGVTRIERRLAIHGQTRSGRRINPLTELPPWSGRFSGSPNHLWHQYTLLLAGQGPGQWADRLRTVVMDRYNTAHPDDPLVRAEVRLLTQVQRLPHEGPETYREEALSGP